MIAFYCIALLFIASPARADYTVQAKSHCGEVYTIVKDNQGNQSVVKENECVSTPNDWK